MRALSLLVPAALLLCALSAPPPASADDATVPPAAPRVRDLVARLGRPVAEGAFEALLDDLDLEDAETATNVARALGRAGGREAGIALAALLEHAEPAVRATVLKAAAHVGLRHEPLARLARRLLSVGSPAERLAAARALGRIGDGRDVPLLLAIAEAVDEPAPLRAAVCRALGTLGQVPPHEDVGRWRAWWESLETRDRPVVEQALAALSDPEAARRESHRTVVHRLGWLDLEAVKAAAETWLTQPEAILRAQACRLIAALRLADLGPAVHSARCFDLHRAYGDDANAALRALGMLPPPCEAPAAAATSRRP